MKIVQAINAMISHQEQITNVKRNDQEYFFLYKERYKWSIILNSQGDYILHLYTSETLTIEDLAAIPSEYWDTIDYVTYKNSEIKTQEAHESFSELFRIVQNKLLGADQILDDILSDF
ncbi:hypothetical protein OQY15_18270 [Pedobacter sp. MC2016-15]|uniref:hypothetical protein n=1 Tax=Pedobacter sp. MC2016-15 TaxID=2994473 RepID=UPI00224666E9|nr:hypothetical protein [Pedobacter sp. MC2016-15]MCX2481056.1 hypothetical protein [Pedobacter sp. MC2016-15]